MTDISVSRVPSVTEPPVRPASVLMLAVVASLAAATVIVLTTLIRSL